MAPSKGASTGGADADLHRGKYYLPFFKPVKPRSDLGRVWGKFCLTEESKTCRSEEEAPGTASLGCGVDSQELRRA